MVLVVRKPTFLHYLWGKQNLLRRCLFIVQTSEKITYNSAVFTDQYIHLQDKLHSFNIQDDRSTRISIRRDWLFSQVILLLRNYPGY